MAPVDGARLTRIGQEIWSADRELMLAAAYRLPVRMVVLRAPGRRLLCYSPVRIDPETLEALQGLGEVGWLAVPNRLHTTFLPEAREAFPGAEVIGCADEACVSTEGLQGAHGLGGFVDCHVVRGYRGFRELVLYHDASETLVLSDLMVNFTAGEPWLEWWLKLNGAWGRPSQTRLRKLRLVHDPLALDGLYRWAMARPFRQISLSHGGIIREDAREIFYQHFRAGR